MRSMLPLVAQEDGARDGEAEASGVRVWPEMGVHAATGLMWSFLVGHCGFGAGAAEVAGEQEVKESKR